MNKKMDNKAAMKSFKRLTKYILLKNKTSVFFVLILIIISSLASVASSLFLKTLIDQYITPMIETGVHDFTPLITALTYMACIYGVGILSAYGYSKLLIEVSQGTLKKIRDDLFAHMEKLPIQYFDTHPHGDIMSIYTNDTDTLRQMISQSIPQCFASLITIVSVFVSMLTLSIPLTGVVVVMVVIMQMALKFLAGKSGIYFKEQQSQLGNVNGYIEEMMEGSKVVKVFTHEDIVKEEFENINQQLYEAAYHANKYSNLLGPVMGNLGNLSYVFTAFLGGVLAINGIGGLTIGSLAAFLQLNRSFNMPISQISQQLNMIIMALAGTERIFNLLDQPVEINDGVVTLVHVTEENGQLIETTERTGVWAWKHPYQDGTSQLVRLVGNVKFENVDFSYVEDKQILHEINLFADQGQKVAFVGATGAGKTTITNLINRFYDIQNGSITYDGIDIKLINKDDLRRSLGIVLQDTHLFTGTIKENIAYARPTATDEEILAASQLANADTFIQHLEHGYDTVLTNDGSSLSQGQRQLLSIARAALANSPVLILDEATSSIDSRTEKIVQSGMDRLMSGRTTFVIAHRLSTIKNSDVIMVMDQGKIIERGNHKSLLEKKGTYYQLYTGAIEID